MQKANVEKRVVFLVQGAVIAALYAALTYLQVLLLPGSVYAAVQFRVSEFLTLLALYTPAAIPGLTVGCVIANLANSALPIDVVFGSLATLMATVAVYGLRNIRVTRLRLPVPSALMPALFNGIIVGLEIEAFLIEGPFHLTDFLLQGGCVALGEIGVLFIIGLPFVAALERRGLDRKLFGVSHINTNNKENSHA